MPRTSRYSPREKAEIILSGLKDPSRVSELCRKHEIAPVTYARWKKKYLEGGQEAMQPGGIANYEEIEKENRRLKLIVAELYVELEYVKKKPVRVR